MNWNVYAEDRTTGFPPLEYSEGEDWSNGDELPVFRGHEENRQCRFYARRPDEDPGGDKNLRFLHLQVEGCAECRLPPRRRDAARAGRTHFRWTRQVAAASMSW